MKYLILVMSIVWTLNSHATQDQEIEVYDLSSILHRPVMCITIAHNLPEYSYMLPAMTRQMEKYGSRVEALPQEYKVMLVDQVRSDIGKYQGHVASMVKVCKVYLSDLTFTPN